MTCLTALPKKVYYDSSNTETVKYSYVYDAQGNLAQQYATSNTGVKTEEYKFAYDSLGRLIRSQEFGANGAARQSTEHLYDTANRLTTQRWTIGGASFYEHYTYNDPGDSTTALNDGSLATMTAATGDTLSFSYDALHRPSVVYVKNTSGATQFYSAQNYKTSGAKTTNQVSNFAYRKSDGTIINYNNYSYDTAGNIASINRVTSTGTGISTQALASYTYDKQNQLKTETRGGTTYCYDYDTAGNILKKYYSGLSTIQSFSYENGDWQDLLTKITIGTVSKRIAYEGQTYNAATNGNPINWYNGTAFTDLTWTQGRRLTSLRKEGFLGYNMFAYALNNPVLLKDSTGEDACIASVSSGAGGFGHVCLFVQDDYETWHYYSFAATTNRYKAFALGILGFYVKGEVDNKVLGKAKGYDLSTFSGFRQFVIDSKKVANTANEMDSLVYLKGDFSDVQKNCQKVSVLRSDYLGEVKSPVPYNARSYNCMYFVLQMLYSGKSITFCQSIRLSRILTTNWAIPNLYRAEIAMLGKELK